MKQRRTETVSICRFLANIVFVSALLCIIGVSNAVASLPRRNLAKSIGILNTVAIRVIDGNGIAPNASVSELESSIFGINKVCLKSQIEACSYGKLRIQPFSGDTETNVTITNGVVEVQIDYEIVEESTLVALKEAAVAATFAQLGDLRSSDKFDLIMYCLPPGIVDWQTQGVPNGKSSFYNNEYCSYVSAQLNQIGTNLNLAPSHAIKDGLTKAFGDKTGFMGTIFDKDDQSMCYNPAKSFQLGWYNDRVDTINPVSDNFGSIRSIILNGVADYDAKNDTLGNESLVVLRLEQTELEKDFYIGYNRKHGINKNTTQDWDMITIVRKEGGGPTEYGNSTKIASLFPGRSYTIGQFNDDRDVEIRFVGTRNGMRDAVVEIVDVENFNDIEEQPEPCANYTIELKTDQYPEDTGWFIAKEEEDGIHETAIVGQTDFREKMTTSTTSTCLPYSSNYKFVILDSRGDGLQAGTYRAIDDNGIIVFSYDGSEFFERRVEYFEVPERDLVPVPFPTTSPSSFPSFSSYPSGVPSSLDNSSAAPTPDESPSGVPSFLDNPTAAPTPLDCPPDESPSGVPSSLDNPTAAPTPLDCPPDKSDPPSEAPIVPAPCKDKRRRIRWKAKRKMRRCKWIAQREKCDFVHKGKSVWKKCRKSCGRCETPDSRDNVIVM